MTTAHGQRLRLRLFLEGVEVPVIAADVQSAPNGPSVATIQIPPLAEATRFHPRTTVHLFFLDLYTAASPFLVETDTDKPNEKNPTAYERQREAAAVDEFLGEDKSQFLETPSDATQAWRDDRANVQYKLLFMGEIIGFQWTKDVNNRSIVLRCEDFSNYWDYAYQWENSGLFGPGIKAVFSGGSTNLFTDFLSSKGAAITGILVSGHCNTFPRLKGLAAGVVRLVEAIGGTYYPRPNSGARRVAGQNLFFSLAELRLHITQMIGAVEDDPTSKLIMQRQGYSGFLDRSLGGLGQQVSIRQALNAVTKVIFHEMYPQPCPLYIPGTDGEVSGTRLTKVKNHPKWGFIADEAEGNIRSLEGIKAVVEGAADNPEVALIGDSLAKDLQARVAAISKRVRQTIPQLRQAPSPAQNVFSTVLQSLGKLSAALGKWRPQGPPANRTAVLTTITDATQQFNRVVNLQVKEGARKDSEPARINQQIFRPDIWFGAPPRCNVLFPELYEQLTYARMFLQEPTRFLLKTNDEFFGEDELFDRYYFAPQAGTTRGDGGRLTDLTRGALLEHELFTGILPIFEKMGEFNVFAGRAGASGGQVPKVSFAQRSANFLYFKHRFNARRMQVTGKFNPYIAVGFPGLIIERPVNEETISIHNELKEKQELPPQDISEFLGTNFLGNFTQVQHQVSQQGVFGKTVITCSYPRQTEETVEFLGAIPDARRVKKQFEDNAVRAIDVAALNPPKLFSLGPNQGRITNVQEVTQRYVTRTKPFVRTAGQELPIFDLSDPTFGRTNPTFVPIGINLIKADIPSNVFDRLFGEVEDPDFEFEFRAFRITEEIPRYRLEDILVPPEEAIRPGWYGDLWGPGKIGKVYNELLAIGAITDPTNIIGPDGSAKGKASEDAESALEEEFNAADAEDPRIHAPAVTALDEGSTIQQAVEFLWLTYSYIRLSGLDTDEFIRAYTWRPIATMVDMFGTSDLEFSSDGEVATSGIEGFHSRAFGPYDNLFGLVSPSIEDILGITRGSTVAQRADTRKAKMEKVQAYVTNLRFSRALLG